MGYFTFTECGSQISPTIGMYRDVVHTFSQADVSNWYHPMGFGYEADGLHRTNGNDERELDPAVTKTNSPCHFNSTCMSPMYYLNDKYLGGNYTNIGPTVIGGGDFGLDGLNNYEQSFFIPRGQWIERGEWSVKLKWTDTDYIKDIFYFCHIHNSMSGRIKLLDSTGSILHPEDDPDLPYEYEVVSDFDKSCGTNGLSDYVNTCPGQSFLCTTDANVQDNDNEDGSRRLSQLAERELVGTSKSKKFSECLGVMDCFMHHDMKILAHPSNPVATFMYQMIPHHINAINMAKALLNLNYLTCNATAEAAAARRTLYGYYPRQKQQRALFSVGTIEDEMAYMGSDCETVDMMWDIINGQNYQVNQMRNWLAKQENLNHKADNCPTNVVEFTDTPGPFFIILGLLATFILMAFIGFRCYQLGLRKGRQHEYEMVPLSQP